MSVTVISCLYGQSHDQFLQDWLSSIRHLNPAAARVVLATDRPLFMPEVRVVTRRNHDWANPQAFYLNKALEQVKNEWVWQVDIDDLAFPDALANIDEHGADVFQMGYERSDGETHLPRWGCALNQYVAGSLIRTDAILSVGGFHDVEHQDSDLWQRLIDAGAIFASADRPRFYYRRHAQARTERERAVAV